jgi:UDP-N-acetylglucosamine--N-acetylmuramyl-(pentapeptide) pyrophosphoryl-undecaprenol N-acetylglucosamine transferase
MHTLVGSLRLLAALWSCLKILRRRQACAVLGMGGYVCFPGGLMTALLHKPLVLVNADASLLMSNKALLPFAGAIAFGFDGDDARRTKRAIVTGNPVRREIESLPLPKERFDGRVGVLRLLVVGGSLGARTLNECVPQALALLDDTVRPRVTHQCGQDNLEKVQAAYSGLRVQAEVISFIDDMAQQLARCDVIVCRAGAGTLSELCAAGVASVLVPLIVSTTSHQRENAQWLAAQGAAIHLPQSELSPDKLAHLLTGLTRQALLNMATKARTLAKPRAAARVADRIESLVTA